MRRKRFFSSSAWFGGVILLLGVLLLLDNMEVLEFGEVFRLWPALLVVWGASMILRRGAVLGKLIGGIIALGGVAVLLGNLGLWRVDFGDLWPLLLVALGLSIMFGARSGRSGPAGQGASDDDFVRRWVAMGGLEQKITTRNLKGGELTAVMGNINLDLREADLAGEGIEIEVFALMASIEVQVPVGWEIVSDVMAIAGAVEDKTAPPPARVDAPVRRLVLRGQAIMAGVEVKH